MLWATVTSSNSLSSEISKKQVEDTKADKEKAIAAKDKEIAACKKKMDEMAREFSTMLQVLLRFCFYSIVPPYMLRDNLTRRWSLLVQSIGYLRSHV